MVKRLTLKHDQKVQMESLERLGGINQSVAHSYCIRVKRQGETSFIHSREILDISETLEKMVIESLE